MPTTVHIPEDLLEKVDERAKASSMTRNRYIVEALRKAISDQTTWSPEFLAQLGKLKPVQGVDDLMRAIKRGRSRKGPPRL